jgi:S-adenosylmethionine:tRNA ribosyltransferase-isomerase
MKELGGPRRLLKFNRPVEEVMKEHGYIPLPPYIREMVSDPELYQTVFSKVPGSAAAPTAGLHFTDELIDRLIGGGIQVARITLHIGLDTFSPVTVEDPTNHQIHTEWCQLSAEVVELVSRTKESGRRVVAVGTTSVRTLETGGKAAPRDGFVGPFEGPTDLYILPGYTFRVVDAMVTNFHLPKTSLLMLVSAFADRKKVLDIYKLAIAKSYRFYSFGDAMLIL